MKVDPSIFVKKKREVDWSMVNLPSYSRVGADVDSAAVHQKQRTREPVTGCTGGGLSGAVTKCCKEEGSHPGGNSAKT